jgi:hypothetical protein
VLSRRGTAVATGTIVREMKKATHDIETRRPITVADQPEPWRELASRRSGGISVGLYWHPQADTVCVHVRDELTEEEFVLEPPRASALVAFYHPYGVMERNGAFPPMYANASQFNHKPRREQ